MDFNDFRTTAATNPIPVQHNKGGDQWQQQENEYPNRWADDSITYVTVTQDRLANLRRNFPVVLPFVDRAVVVDGFSKDGSYEYLSSLGPKVQVFQREWDDSFANQYNEYLRHIKGGWVLLCDDDEVPSQGMLENLREFVRASEGGTKFGVVEFKSNDISYHEGDWENRVDNGPCDYWRQIFFKHFPDMKYTVDLHQALQGMRGPVARTDHHYYHIKTTKDEFRNACRNYFISGEWGPGPRVEGDKTPEWHELKNLLSQHHPEVKLFSHLNSLLVTGKLHPSIEDWIRKNKDHNRGVDGESSGELRAYYRYYFEILHPEKV